MRQLCARLSLSLSLSLRSPSTFFVACVWTHLFLGKGKASFYPYRFFKNSRYIHARNQEKSRWRSSLVSLLFFRQKEKIFFNV
jgi:hypothetical protein